MPVRLDSRWLGALAVAALVALAAASCGTPSLGNDGGVDGGSGGTGGSDGGGGGGSGGGAGGGSGGGGGGGSGGGGGGLPDGGCYSACDCDPGLACFNSQCIAGFAPVYCCTGTTCPSGSGCQYPTRNFSQCGRDGGFSLPDGGFSPRDGGYDYCPLVNCAADTRCLNAGCTTCTAAGTCAK